MERLFLVIMFLFLALSSKACDCIPVHTFMKSIGQNVFLAEVIESGGECPGSFGNSPRLRVKVLDNFVGRVGNDTVLIQEGIGERCLGPLVSRKQGDTLIVTGQIGYCIADSDDTVIRIDGSSPYMRIRSCAVQSLKVRGDQVFGMITKNKFRKRQETSWWLLKYSPLRFLPEEKRKNIYSVNAMPEDEQQMSIEKLKQLIFNVYK